MVKVDKRRKYIMVLDVETANGLGCPIVYDIGLVITDKQGRIYETRSFIIKEIFDNKKMMDSAYYAEKVPMYLQKLEDGLMEKVSFAYARDVINSLLVEYGVSVFSAYNLNFDKRALVNTWKYLGNVGKFLQKNVDLLCIWSFACEVIYTQKTYKMVAQKMGWVSEKGNLKTSAEMGERYLSGNYNFVEEHTGLEDSVIEAKILSRCYRQNKAHKSGILGNPWQIPNRVQLA